MFKKSILFLALLFILLFLFFFTLRFFSGNEDDWICENNNWVKHGNPSSKMPLEGCGEPIVEETTPSTTEEKIIGGDKDEGGCLIGAGYSWCELKQKCLRVWEEPCE